MKRYRKEVQTEPVDWNERLKIQELQKELDAKDTEIQVRSFLFI